MGHQSTASPHYAMSDIDALDGPLERHCNVPIHANDSLKTEAILVFAERLLLAISPRHRLLSITTG